MSRKPFEDISNTIAAVRAGDRVLKTIKWNPPQPLSLRTAPAPIKPQATTGKESAKTTGEKMDPQEERQMSAEEDMQPRPLYLIEEIEPPLAAHVVRNVDEDLGRIERVRARNDFYRFWNPEDGGKLVWCDARELPEGARKAKGIETLYQVEGSIKFGWLREKTLQKRGRKREEE